MSVDGSRSEKRKGGEELYIAIHSYSGTGLSAGFVMAIALWPSGHERVIPWCFLA